MATPSILLQMPNSSATSSQPPISPRPKTTTANCPLLSLPGELRVQIYSYLVPTQCEDHCTTTYNLRLVCRQIKDEIEYEAENDIIDHFKKGELEGLLQKLGLSETVSGFLKAYEVACFKARMRATHDEIMVRHGVFGIFGWRRFWTRRCGTRPRLVVNG